MCYSGSIITVFFGCMKKMFLLLLSTVLVGLLLYVFLFRDAVDPVERDTESDIVYDTAKEDVGDVHIYVKTTQGLFEKLQQKSDLFSEVEQQVVEDPQYTDPVVRLTFTYDQAKTGEVAKFLTDQANDRILFGSKVFFDRTQNEALACGTSCRVSVYAIPLSRLLSE